MRRVTIRNRGNISSAESEQFPNEAFALPAWLFPMRPPLGPLGLNWREGEAPATVRAQPDRVRVVRENGQVEWQEL